MNFKFAKQRFTTMRPYVLQSRRTLKFCHLWYLAADCTKSFITLSIAESMRAKNNKIGSQLYDSQVCSHELTGGDSSKTTRR